MLQQRILLQNPMSKVAKFPSEVFYDGDFIEPALLEKVNKSKRHIKQHIKELTQIQSDLFKLSETSVKIKEIS